MHLASLALQDLYAIQKIQEEDNLFRLIIKYVVTCPFLTPGFIEQSMHETTPSRRRACMRACVIVNHSMLKEKRTKKR